MDASFQGIFALLSNILPPPESPLQRPGKRKRDEGVDGGGAPDAKVLKQVTDVRLSRFSVPSEAQIASLYNELRVRNVFDIDIQKINKIDGLTNSQVANLATQVLRGNTVLPKSGVSESKLQKRLIQATSIIDALKIIRGHTLTPGIVTSLFSIKSDEKNDWLFKQSLYSQCEDTLLETYGLNRMLKSAYNARDPEFTDAVYLKTVRDKKENAFTLRFYLKALQSNKASPGKINPVAKKATDANYLNRGETLRLIVHAEEAKDPNEALRLFLYAIKQGFADGEFIGKYISAANQAANFLSAQFAFRKFLELKIASPDPYLFYIVSAARKENFSEVYRAYNLAITNGVLNASIYAEYINAMKVFPGKFSEGKVAFELAVSTEQVNEQVVLSYIKLAVLSGDIGEVHDTYQLAFIREITSPAIYRAYLSVLKTAGDDELFEKICDIGIQEGKFNEELYCYYLKYARKRGKLDLAECIFEYANKQGKLSPDFYRYYVEIQSLFGTFSGCKTVFYRAVSEDHNHPDTYKTFILAAENSGNFLEAGKAFEMARKQGYLKTPGLQSRWEERQNTFEKMQKYFNRVSRDPRRFNNPEIYIDFMKAAWSFGLFEEVARAQDLVIIRQINDKSIDSLFADILEASVGS